jgi:hypothetical protein
MLNRTHHMADIMRNTLLNIAMIISLLGQLLVPSFAMSNEMAMSDMQSSSMHQSTMMQSDCDTNDDCCLNDMSQCISHCHAVANAFLLSTTNLTDALLTSAKVSSPLWTSTPTILVSQNPPPIA